MMQSELTGQKDVIDHILGKSRHLDQALSALQNELCFVKNKAQIIHNKAEIEKIDEIKKKSSSSFLFPIKTLSWDLRAFKASAQEAKKLGQEMVDFKKSLKSLGVKKPEAMSPEKIKSAEEKSEDCIKIFVEFEEMLNAIAQNLENPSPSFQIETFAASTPVGVATVANTAPTEFLKIRQEKNVMPFTKERKQDIYNTLVKQESDIRSAWSSINNCINFCRGASENIDLKRKIQGFSDEAGAQFRIVFKFFDENSCDPKRMSECGEALKKIVNETRKVEERANIPGHFNSEEMRQLICQKIQTIIKTLEESIKTIESMVKEVTEPTVSKLSVSNPILQTGPQLPAIPETTQAPPTRQQSALKELETRWNEFVAEMRNKSPSETTNEKLQNIYEYCDNLESGFFTKVVTSQGMYDDLTISTAVRTKDYFFAKLITSKSSEYFLNILSLIPLPYIHDVLEKSFGSINNFFTIWLSFKENGSENREIDPAIILKLPGCLDSKTKNIFFQHIVTSVNEYYISKLLQSAKNDNDDDTFERIFLMRCKYHANHDKFVYEQFVKKFLELTDSKPQQRKNLIAKIDPKIREVFVQALPQNEVPTRKPTSTSETNQATLLPDMSSPTPHTTESKPGTTVPDSMRSKRVFTPGAVVPPAGSKKIYWLMGAVLVAAIILSVLYANLLIAGCVAGGGLLAMGALWFFKKRSYGAGKAAPSPTALGHSGAQLKDESGMGQTKAMIFSYQQGAQSLLTGTDLKAKTALGI